MLMPVYSVTASYYELYQIEAESKSEAIDYARTHYRLPGSVPFDEFEAEQIYDEDDHSDVT